MIKSLSFLTNSVYVESYSFSIRENETYKL